MIQPTRDNVIIKIENTTKGQETKSGIFIPASVNQQQKPDQGIVVAVGTGRVLNNGETLPIDVKEGQTVIFNRFAGTEIQANEDEIYLIIKENDIMAIINE